jgi:glycosyltransferase involved in cell wall biosynthesis
LLGELGLSDRVLFAGVQTNVSLYYAAADVAVCSSIETETFGRVAVEAQAMGKPVIATAHGGFLETVRHGVTGLLVDPEAPAEMTAALEQLLAMSPGDRAAMGAEARRWVTQNFSVEKMCEAEFSAYKQILNLGDSP